MENETKIECAYCREKRDPKDIVEATCHRRDRKNGKAYVRTDKYKVCKDKQCGGYLQMSFEG